MVSNFINLSQINPFQKNLLLPRMSKFEDFQLISHQEIPVTLSHPNQNINLCVLSFPTESFTKKLGKCSSSINQTSSQKSRKQSQMKSQVSTAPHHSHQKYDIRIQFDRQPHKYFTTTLPKIQGPFNFIAKNSVNPQNQKLHLLLEMSRRHCMLSVTNVYRDVKMVIKNGRGDRKNQSHEKQRKKENNKNRSSSVDTSCYSL